MDLETILVNVMQRTRNLKMETMVLDNWTSDKNDSVLVRNDEEMLLFVFIVCLKFLFFKILTPQKLTTLSSSTTSSHSCSLPMSSSSQLKKQKTNLGKPQASSVLENFIVIFFPFLYFIKKISFLFKWPNIESLFQICNFDFDIIA